jgi:hypothetical protein
MVVKTGWSANGVTASVGATSAASAAATTALRRKGAVKRLVISDLATRNSEL